MTQNSLSQNSLSQNCLPSYQSLIQPLPAWHPKRMYYGLFKQLLNSVGQLSDGIAIGSQYGFDSGVMLEYVYRNQPSGKNWLGKVIDRIYLNSQGWQGIREREQILKGVLRQTIQTYIAQGIPVHLLDVACGGGRYDLEVLSEFPAGTITATLRDYMPENVKQAQVLATQLGVTATIQQADAFSDAALEQVFPRPNLIVVSGLHEILPDDDQVSNHFHQLHRILAPKGVLIFTIQPYHPQLELIARVLNSHTGKPWAMRLRSYELTQTWAIAAGFKGLQTQMDSFGIFGVVQAYKE